MGQYTKEKCAILTSCADALKLKVLLISSLLGKEAKILCFVSIVITARWADALSVVASSQESLFFIFLMYISHITVWKYPLEMSIEENCKD